MLADTIDDVVGYANVIVAVSQLKHVEPFAH
jgi:hypothetical protein